LVVAGRPGVVPEIAGILDDADLAIGVTYLQSVPREEVPGLFRTSDILVETSESENFGSAVAEALACGIPVVVGPSNGTADYIDPGSAVFDSYTPESVARSILDVLERNGKEGLASRESRRIFAMHLLSPESVSARFEELLGTVV
jgi:glycosyltransferase involved in cell wall biosynthesis